MRAFSGCLQIGLCLASFLVPQVSAQNFGGIADLRQKALLLESQKNDAEAEAAWRQILAADSKNAEANAHCGVLEARHGNLTAAIPFYKAALQTNPGMRAIRQNLGLAYFKSSQLKEAVAIFEDLRQSAPAGSGEGERMSVLAGMAHYGLAEYPAAIEPLREAAAVDKTNLPLRLALAHSCLWSKQVQCVLDVYQEMLALNAESAEADMLAGEALDEMKDSAGAIKLFRQAVAVNPKEPDVHYGLGYLLWTQKQYDEAEKEFLAELANDPGHLQAMLYLGDTLIQDLRYNEAQPWLEKVTAHDGKNALAHLDLGIVLTEAHQNEAALVELKKAEELTPEDANVHWRLGKLYRAVNRVAEAKAEFDKAAALKHDAKVDLARQLDESRQRGAPEHVRTDAPSY